MTWTVLAHSGRDLQWTLADGRLRLDARAAIGTPSGSIVAFSPRRPASPGPWTAEVEVTCCPPALLDLAVVAGCQVPVPGPPPQATPYIAGEVGEEPVRMTVTRELGPDARTVGLRLRGPLGCEVVVRAASVGGQDLLAAEPPASREPFAAGALLARGERLLLPVAADVVLEDRYRGGARPIVSHDGMVEVPTDRNGAYAVVVSRDGVPLTSWRYVVDDDTAPVAVDRKAPWGLTVDTHSVDVTAELIALIGVRHVRTYSGLASWDLPAVLAVADPDAATALVDALHFTAAAAGSPAAVAARAVSGVRAGNPRAGWPDWTTAAGFLGSAEVADLTPQAALFEPLRGHTLLAETSRTDDPQVWVRVVERAAQEMATHEMSWVACNEPDLGLADTPPEEVARQSLTFAAGVRRGDPDAVLVGPALADGWDGGHQGMWGWDWLRRWLAAGGAAAVDAVSVHLHMLDEETRTPEREGLEARLAQLRELVPDHPLWVTEMGWRSEPDSLEAGEPGESGPAVSEGDQADLLVRAAVLAAAAGVERFYAFHLTGWRVTGDGHRFAWGVLSGHHDGPKPAFAALRRLCKATADKTAAPPLATSTRTRAVPFLGDDVDLHVVWQWSGGAGLWALEDLPAGAQLCDLMGEPSDGSDLRRPLVLHTSTAERSNTQRWLRARLAPRYGEPSLPEVSYATTS